MSKQDTERMSQMQRNIYLSMKKRLRIFKDGRTFYKLVDAHHRKTGLTLGQLLMSEASNIAHDDKASLKGCMDSLRQIISEHGDETMMEAFERVNRKGTPPNGWLENYPFEVMVAESAAALQKNTQERRKAYQVIVNKWREYYTYMLPPQIRYEASATFRI